MSENSCLKTNIGCNGRKTVQNIRCVISLVAHSQQVKTDEKMMIRYSHVYEQYNRI